jgi:hypothetical protein
MTRRCGRRPRLFGNPSSRQYLVAGRRFHALGHPGAKHRLVHHTGVDALEPVVPPSQDFLQESDLRTGQRKVRIGMRPGSDEAFARHREMFEQTRDCVLVAVGPTADRVDRALDRGVVLAHRPPPPEVVAPLVAQPSFEEQRHMLEALQPHRAATIADQRRVGRVAHRGKEERRPVEPRGQQSAAHVVHVVAVPVVGRADRHDRLQRRWTTSGDLECVEATPGDPHHSDCATAPGLRRQPRDDLQRVVLLLPGVLVEQQATGLAAAPDIDPHAGIAVAGQIRMRHGVPLIGAVPLAIRQVLKDGGHRAALGILRQPDTRCQRRAVVQRDQRVFDDADGAGKCRDDQTTLHCVSSPGSIQEIAGSSRRSRRNASRGRSGRYPGSAPPRPACHA